MKFFKLRLVLCMALLPIIGMHAQDFAAVAFSGSDYISTNWNPAFGADQDFSIDFAVRTDGWSSDPSLLSDKDWNSGSNAGFNIALAGSGAGIDVNVGDGGNRADLEAGSINDGQWHNVLVSFDRDGFLKMWIDGLLVDSTDMSNVGNIDSPFNFNIAQDGTGTYGAATTAEMTNMRIWNAALTYENIADIVCDQITPGHPSFADLGHYFFMQEGMGTEVSDIIGGNVGTFEGMPTWVGGFFPDASVGFGASVDASTVTFGNTSSGATAYFWDFGDGNTSTQENPQHTYLTTGTFEVTLISYALCGTLETTQTITIDELTEGLLVSLDLDGVDDQVTLTNDLAFANDQDFTIELFVRSGGWSADPGIISNKNWNSGSNPGFILAGKTDGTTWKFNIGDGGNRIDLDGGVINDEQWHHIAVVYDQDGMKQLWQDGAYVASTDDVINGNVDTALDLIIGADGNGNYPFTGQVAEVRIWDTALDSMTLADFVCGADDSHPAFDNLLHYYRLNEGMGTAIADSKGSNNGTYNGEWTTTLNTIPSCDGSVVVGEVFNAAFLASTSREDYIATTWMPAFGESQDFTIDFRVKTEGWDGDPAIISNKDWNSGSNPGFNIALSPGGGQIDVNVGDGANRADLDAGLIADGTWHHVMATFDRDGEVALYVDGELVQSTDMSFVGNIDTDFNLNIGQDGTGNYSEGFSSTGPVSEIAEVRVWNRVMNPAEVSICESLEMDAMVWEDLLHYWKMDEGNGTIAADSKGDTDGTWQGQEAWTNQNSYPNAIAAFSEDIFLSNVSFINQSTPGAYFWDFGDGTTSEDANPTHLYLATGTFEVKLYVTNACSVDSLSKMIEIAQLDNNLLTSLDLDGQDDYVQFENNTIEGTNDFTVELYVRSAGWNSDPSIIANKDWGSGSNPGFIVAGRGDGQTWKINVGDGTNRIDLNGGVINDGLWHHIAFSFDQDGEKAIYQDGMEIESTTEILGDITSGLDLAIGQDGTLNYGAFFAGQVAEVRVWNAALDSLTIASYICDVEDHPNGSDLAHYWKMDEGEGTVINDAAGMNTGSYNGAWIVTSNTLENCEAPIPVNEVAGGNAIDFDGFDDHVTVPQNDIFEIEQNITLEAWVKARSFNQWESFLNYVQDNGSNESGFDFAYVDGKLRFRIMTENMGGNDWNNNPGAELPLNTWVHVAGTYDGETIKMYVNGQLIEQENKDGALDWEFQPVELRIGGYIDDNELYYWDGAVDEVRIWEVARTEEEIRQMMCIRLEGEEEGLLAYYRMDELAGSTVYDLGPNGLNGEMFDMVPAEDRVISGAGIGDESIYIYPENWTDVSLSLNSNAQGMLTLDNVQGTGDGVQLYRVDATPQLVEDFPILENNAAYFGIVPTLNSANSFDLTLDYTDVPDALADEANLLLGARQSAEQASWINTAAVVDEANDQIVKTAIGGRREVVLGNGGDISCAFPSNAVLNDATFSTLDISWSSPAGSTNVEFGPAGFALGNGTFVQNAEGNIVIIDLEAATSIDLYLQDICGDGEFSTWVGPFTFSTESCRPPMNISVDDIAVNAVTFVWENSDNATSYNIEWGFAGFQLGLGIAINDVAESGYRLEGLPANTELEFYVQSICGDAGESEWVGPFSFSTLMVNLDELDANFTQMVLSPNPASGRVMVQVLSNTDMPQAKLEVRNLLGQVLYSEQISIQQDYRQELNLQQLAAGTYLVTVQSGTGILTQKLIIE